MRSDDMMIARRTFVGAALTLAASGCRQKQTTEELGDGFYPVRSKKPLELDRSDFVPLILERPPQADKQGDGRLFLNIKLERKYARALEAFTRRHLGATVAIVVDGEVITMHEMKEVITGGTMKITWCGENGCERVLTKLTD